MRQHRLVFILVLCPKAAIMLLAQFDHHLLVLGFFHLCHQLLVISAKQPDSVAGFV
jgi:hypothetical protein